VARRAGLPLASTTYYFSSLDDLVASAVEHIGMLEVAQLRARVAGLSRRRRGPEATADVLVDLLVGDGSAPRLTEQLISRYERYIACARLPSLRDVQQRNLGQRAEAVAEALERSGRSAQIELVSALICAADGAVVSALVDDRRDPRAAARATLFDIIDVLVPVDHGPVRI
jgi:DNA-binding transcriptional regulator YbjK